MAESELAAWSNATQWKYVRKMGGAHEHNESDEKERRNMAFARCLEIGVYFFEAWAERDKTTLLLSRDCRPLQLPFRR